LVRSNRKDNLIQWKEIFQRIFLFSPELASTFLNYMKYDNTTKNKKGGESQYVESQSNLLRDTIIDCPQERTRIYSEYD
jgi:hypothetical protein